MRVTARLAAVVLLVCPALLSVVTAGPAWAANPPVQGAERPRVSLAAHRALYKLSLASTRGGRDVTAAAGTMGYEIVDVCDGWAARQRLRMTLTNVDGQDVEMASDYATWESKDGLNLRFHMVEKTDDATTSQTDGTAHLNRSGGPGEAVYRLPKVAKVALPSGTLFPMMHTVAVIQAAREGKKFLSLPLFDGTDENGPEDSSVAVIDWKPSFPTRQAILAPLASTRVRIAFFDHASQGQTPTYEAAMRYWENGVADEMLMDFGDFVMRATMTELTMVPRRC